MGNIKKRLATAAATAALVLGGSLAVAPAASALTMYESQVRQCHWVHVYTVYDFNWWEETFYGKRDSREYIYSYYSYSPQCASVRV